jgi:hypothetical protein
MDWASPQTRLSPDYKVVVYGAVPVRADGVYLNLRFRGVGCEGSSTDLAINGFRLNDGTQTVTAINSRVTISAANTASIQGRLVTPFGKGIPDGRVFLTSTDGGQLASTSRQGGLFEFWGLTVGQTYTLAVRTPNFTFQPQTVSVVENVTRSI